MSGHYGMLALPFRPLAPPTVTPLDALRRRFRHHAWAGATLADAIRRTPAPDALRPFAHALAADRVWHRRLTYGPTNWLEIWPALDAAGCDALLRETTADWQRYLDGPVGLGETLAYRTSRGEPFETAVADVLDHVLLHAAHHRGQACVALRAAGAVPPALDVVVWARAGEPSS